MAALRLYAQFIRIQLKTTLQYRASFFAGAAAQFFSYAVSFLMIWIVVRRFQSLNGWSPYEVVLLYSINLLTYALGAFFFFNLNRNLPVLIRNGDFDGILLRPLNPLWHLVSRDFNPGYLSHLFTSLLLLCVCLAHLSVKITPGAVVFLLLTVLGGALIQGGMLLICTVPVFWLIKNDALVSILFFNLKSFVQYPISIYSRGVQILLTFVLPYAFISYYPAQRLLHKGGGAFASPVLGCLSPAVGLAVMGIAYGLWCFGLRNYTSTGS